MAGDLEDFLRRAAERRQAKAAADQQEQLQNPQRQRPEYSNRRTERLSQIPDDEEILTAEIVEEPATTMAAQIQRTEDANRAQARAQSDRAKQMKEDKAQEARDTRTAAREAVGLPAMDLIRLLRKPGGIQQAILLREILDRPEHRW